MYPVTPHARTPSWPAKLWQVNWGLVLLLGMVAAIGIAVLYSAADARMEPWASRQLVRFFVGLVIALIIAVTDIRLWFKFAFFLYFSALVLLAAVEFVGYEAMGAQRWISIGIIGVQPAEIMKIAVVLALARYFHGIGLEQGGRLRILFVPVVLVAVPMALMIRQPDLGTAAIILAAGFAMVFLAGVRLWMLGSAAIVGLVSIPIVWQFLREYQQQRILTFLDPESDPLGAGYHVLQSKIALGSGGLFGRGFLEGTQSQLDFLPERHTDFIFTMLAEEFGLLGGLALLALYILLLAYGIGISLRSRNQFGRLLGMGVTTTFFLYVFINIAMVMGIVPVVGAPLPLISYGGTAMLTVMIGFGFLMNVWVHRDVRLGRTGAVPDP